MQQGYGAIEAAFNILRTGGGEVNGSHFPFGKFMVVPLIVTLGNGK